MKYCRLVLVLTAFIFALFSSSGASAQAEGGDYLLFEGRGCPHCANVEAYLESVTLPPSVKIIRYDIYVNRDDARLFNEMTDALNIPLNSRGVPFLIAPENTVVYGDVPIIEYFKKIAVDKEGAKQEQPAGEETASSGKPKLTAWMLITAALADSVNPCEFAVLILLMTSLLAAGDRRRALWTGIAFIATIFVSYLLMGIGLYHALSTVASTYWIFLTVGILAVLIGLFNIKDAVAYGKGFLLEVPMSWRPKMKALLRSVTSPVGAVVIALLISLFLLPCTSGPYIVVLGMLSQTELFGRALGWLILYNAIFILPMVAILVATYFGISVKRAEMWRQNYVRWFHAIAGVIMLGIGIWILVRL